jgi:hypothetical protein
VSKVIEALKTVKEKISHNYTSYQLLKLLDTLLFRALAPIIETTDFFDRVLANVIGWAATNPRRKLSALPRARFNTLAMAYLASSDPKMKIRIVKKLKLERNIIFFTLAKFADLSKDLTAEAPPHSLVRQLSVTHPDQLWFAVRLSLYWFNQASKFKNMMIEKYLRLVVNETMMYYNQQKKNNPHLKFDLDDIAQNFALAVSKAIDKCDADQGVLTTYVQNWIKDAKNASNFRHEYGIAYSIPASRRRALAESDDLGSKHINISVHIDSDELTGLESDSNLEQELLRKDTIKTVRQLAKHADPDGISRLFLGIGEILSAEELHRLHRLT